MKADRMQHRSTPNLEQLRQQVGALTWYHTLDLGNGIITPGKYDHRPFLHHYGIPEDLTGKTALDVGAASGFFAFELEKRGAKVTAVDLPAWLDHDFGPCYEPDITEDAGLHYLREPIRLARQILGRQIEKIETTIYDLSPEAVGTFDLVFCGSLLLHLTDPIRALWRLQSVTREQAIIATAVYPGTSPEPLAIFVGHHRGDTWWFPNRACLESMVQSAGFTRWEWVSDFRLDCRDGRPGLYHGVIHAWNNTEPQGRSQVKQASHAAVYTLEDPGFLRQLLTEREVEIGYLRDLVQGYERGRFIRMTRWLHGQYDRLRTRLVESLPTVAPNHRCLESRRPTDGE